MPANPGTSETAALSRILAKHDEIERAAHDGKILLGRMIRDASADESNNLTVTSIGRALGWTKSQAHDWVRRWADRPLSTD